MPASSGSASVASSVRRPPCTVSPPAPRAGRRASRPARAARARRPRGGRAGSPTRAARPGRPRSAAAPGSRPWLSSGSPSASAAQRRQLGHLGPQHGVGHGQPEPLHLLVEEALRRLEEPRALARVGDERAPALDPLDQALRLEPLEREPHRRARDPEAGADLRLGGEPLAGRAMALHDLLAQEPGELEVERDGRVAIDGRLVACRDQALVRSLVRTGPPPADRINRRGRSSPTSAGGRSSSRRGLCDEHLVDRVGGRCRTASEASARPEEEVLDPGPP